MPIKMTNNQDDWMSLALKREAEIERLHDVIDHLQNQRLALETENKQLREALRRG